MSSAAMDSGRKAQTGIDKNIHLWKFKGNSFK